MQTDIEILFVLGQIFSTEIDYFESTEIACQPDSATSRIGSTGPAGSNQIQIPILSSDLALKSPLNSIDIADSILIWRCFGFQSLQN